MLFLNQQDIKDLLDIDQLIDALEPAMIDLTMGVVAMPQRLVMELPDEQGLLGLMPVYAPSSGILSTKLVSVYPNNPRNDLPGHQAIIAVFDASAGTPLMIMDGAYITAVRTAAGSALATRLLARPDAQVLLIVGSGVQAWAHVQAIPRVRSIKEIRVVARDAHKGQQFTQRVEAELGIAAGYVPSFREAAAGADIVCATTHAHEPVVFGQWLEPGTHLISVGLSETGRELDAATVIRSLVVVESRTAVLAEGPGGANDLKIPIAEGLITADHIHAEIGELLNGTRDGRTAADQITLYKSVGVAVQDAAAAKLVMDAALARGVGVQLDLQGRSLS